MGGFNCQWLEITWESKLCLIVAPLAGQTSNLQKHFPKTLQPQKRKCQIGSKFSLNCPQTSAGQVGRGSSLAVGAILPGQLKNGQKPQGTSRHLTTETQNCQKDV